MSSAFVSGPPPLPESASATRKRFYVVISIVLLVCVILLVSGYFVIRYVVATGITRTVDNQFGDQHLKTAVALIELHKVRYGRYPDSLRDLRFTGSWDAIALNSVRYYPSPNRDAYYIEVERGWMGKPTLVTPTEFWKGSGYSESLRPAKR
jgi:hypothetical protein